MIIKVRSAVGTAEKPNTRHWRQAEEGQAMLLVGVFMLVMVALLGLVADLEVSQLGKDNVSNAAQDAARAGAPYIYSSRAEADSQAIMAAESYGFKLGCFYRPDLSDSDPYNKDCRRANWQQVQHAPPDKLYYFESQSVNDKGLIHYTVKIGKLQSRLFLAIIGFPNYPILQSSTATFKPNPLKPVVPPPPMQPPTGQPPATQPDKTNGLTVEEELAKLFGATGLPGNAANKNGWPGSNANNGYQANGGTSFQPACSGKIGCK